MQSMRAPSLALAYCLTARAVPGPHRPSRPKWELGLQVFDYFEEPGLGRRPHNHHHHSLQKVPSRPAGRRFAEKPHWSSLPAAGTSSPAASSGRSVVQTPNTDLVCRPAIWRTHGHSQTARECSSRGREGRSRKGGRQTQTQSLMDLPSLSQPLEALSVT